MEFAYVIRKIKNFRVSTRATSRKLQRAYPYHWALGFGWTGKLDFETVVASLLKAKYYWRKNGKEIDFLLVNNKILPIEVKEGTKIDKNELKSLVYFMKKFNLSKGIIVYDGEEEKVKIGNIVLKKYLCGNYP